MSDATIRHVNALGLKYEVLKEVKHWKQACVDCESEVRGQVKSLRESRAVIKREINLARAKLEEALRRLEKECERELNEMVVDETKVMSFFVQKLESNRKRLNTIESSLKSNLVGTILTKSIDDGKMVTKSTRDTLMKIKKYEMASRLEFNVTPHLQSVLDVEKTLGLLSFVTKSGTKREEKIHMEMTAKRQGLEREEEVHANYNEGLSEFENTSSNSLHELVMTQKSLSIEETMIKDLQFLANINSKYEHSLKPFINSVKDMSTEYKKSGLTKNVGKLPNPNPKLTVTIPCEQSRNKVKRPKSEITPRMKCIGLGQRPSKSATDKQRLFLESNKCLNDIHFVPFEEQGPNSDSLEKMKYGKTVRYNDYELVKEISKINSEDEVQTNISFISTNGSEVIDRVRSAGSQSTATICSVTYKPSNSLSSGPVNISLSQQSSAKSYFRYIAKFHTRKHGRETDLCRLTSILALDNGQVIITDINHQQIMLFASDFTYLDTLECPSPCGLGHVSQNTIVVTLFHNRKIMYVKVHMLYLERSKELYISCPEPLFAVTYNCGRHFVLCHAGHIHILDDDGKQTDEIETGIQDGDARFMNVEEENGRIFISGKDRIVCFSDTGMKLWQYTSRDSHRRFTPGDIVLYQKRLFVADWCGNKILELSLDGVYVRDVVTENIESPHAITIQPKHGRLLIAQSNYFKLEAKSRSVKVFEIK